MSDSKKESDPLNKNINSAVDKNIDVESDINLEPNLATVLNKWQVKGASNSLRQRVFDDYRAEMKRKRSIWQRLLKFFNFSLFTNGSTPQIALALSLVLLFVIGGLVLFFNRSNSKEPLVGSTTPTIKPTTKPLPKEQGTPDLKDDKGQKNDSEINNREDNLIAKNDPRHTGKNIEDTTRGINGEKNGSQGKGLLAINKIYIENFDDDNENGEDKSDKAEWRRQLRLQLIDRIGEINSSSPWTIVKQTDADAALEFDISESRFFLVNANNRDLWYKDITGIYTRPAQEVATEVIVNLKKALKSSSPKR